MNVFALILAVLAFCLFLFPGGNLSLSRTRAYAWSSVHLGLALLTAAWVVQLMTHRHNIHF